jgi:hypothetical protein
MSNVAPMESLRRLALVEQRTVEAGGWNMQVALALADELDCHYTTVYGYWRKVKAFARRGVTTDIDKWRRQQIATLDNVQMEARKNKDYSGAVRAIEVQAKIIGTIAPTNVNVNHAVTVVNPALVAQMSRMSVDELRSLTDAKNENAAPIIEAAFEPVAEVEPAK